MEAMYPGRDFRMAPDPYHNHGTSTIKYGRGAVLTVDLTNRCNMMCNPCFMDANQVGYVHELTWEEVKEILDHSIQIKPRRQMSVQFSGGEPTISPFFLEAVAYARKVGYESVQAATNGIRFAQDESFARAAKLAGMRLAYLQFDGVTNEANMHRGVGNLFEVKQRAIENMHAAGIDITLVVTIVNSVNNEQVGPIVQFAIDNIDKINAVSFQPVSFTGRDEDVDDATRDRQRYTLSHLARDLNSQLGVTEPMRDWYPLSASGPFSDLKDLMDGENSEWGSLKCGCHPNCGIGTMLLVNEKTKEVVPFPKILNTDRFMEDLRQITDAARGKTLTVAQVVLSLMRNYNHAGAPEGLSFWDLVKIIDGHNGQRLGLAEKGRYDWRVLLVAGMWFQDLFNYDFRRTEMCIIPYGTQVGEVSFCAYNTGVGWRNIVENMFQVASTKEWYKTRGRHKVYAAGHPVPLPETLEAAPGRKKVKLPMAKGPEVAAGSTLAGMPGVRITGMETGCGSH
jgi:7,8-dihydro-6-hydroxymethylpterin dimethyltransferase